MTNLLTSEQTDAFLAAMRDVADTFQKYPVAFGDPGDQVTVPAGRKCITAKLKAREDGMEVDQAYELRINRQVLEEMDLVDEAGLLIGYGTPVWMDGESYVITGMDEKTFQDRKVTLVMEVLR